MIYKDERHLYYTIENSRLWEIYSTIRGERSRLLGFVSYPDRERVSPEEIRDVENAAVAWTGAK